MATSSSLHFRRKIQRILYSKPIIVLLAVLTVLLGYWTYLAYQKMTTTGQQLEAVQEDRQRLVERKGVLTEKFNDLQTVRGQEAEIRKRFNVVKEGENMVVIIDKPATTSQDKKIQQGIFSRMWEAIRFYFLITGTI